MIPDCPRPDLVAPEPSPKRGRRRPLDPILADLNEAQQEAVTYDGGPLLVVAGAGSGKTRVITRRIAWRVKTGLYPSQILAITFTNKAAGEMKSRVNELLGDTRVWVSTFHALGARLLRMEAEAAGLDRSFTIFDASDQLAVVREVMKELRLKGRDHRPREYLEAISRLKTRGEDSPAEDDEVDEDHLRVYQRYQQALRLNEAVDFDDLLLRPLQLLVDNDEVRERFVSRFKTVLIDEYQDTNHIQYLLARVIAGGHGDICATGDPDQSIYRWRGAEVRNIVEFENDFPGARVVKLEENYRSTNRILKAASAVISNNRGRIERDLWSSLGDGETIRVFSASTESDEARRIVDRIREAEDDGYGLEEIAVFYRTNAASRAIEQAMRLSNLPYVIVGAVAFYERREVKDLLAYLRVIQNPANAVDLQRVINVPARKIGAATVAKLKETAADQGVALRDLLLRAGEFSFIRANTRREVVRFGELLRDIASLPPSPVLPILDRVLDRTQYLPWLRELDDPTVDDRLENVEELRRALAEFDLQSPGGTLDEFLNETALLRSRAEEESGDTIPRVTLMTLHSAKGLEFPVVFLMALEEGMLPHSRSLDSDEAVEEERRLMYVGITRAQRRLTLSYSFRRVGGGGAGGGFGASIPSRFLSELPEELCEGLLPRRRDLRAVVETEAWYEPDPDSDEPPFAAGEAVVHDTFGRGRVVALTGYGPSAKITVDFGRFGTKRLILEYARLQKAYDA